MFGGRAASGNCRRSARSNPAMFRFRFPISRRRRMLLLGIGLGIIAAVVSANFIPSEKKLEQLVVADYSIDDPQFLRSMGSLFGAPLVGGNTTTELINGDRIFPAMLEAIRGAQRTITFETFIYWSGEIGREFADALVDRARAGVKVHVLLDFVGSARMEKGLIKKMTDAGCEVVKFHPLRWYHLSRFNNRTHRKLLVVDGRVGFTGGVGIGDEWTGDAQDAQHWRDTHFRVVGPVVAQMQATFMTNWIKARSQVQHSEPYFPALENAGSQYAQMFHSSPEEGSEDIRLMYLLSIAAARRTLFLEQAYFLPDDLVTDMLVAAAQRGVRIEVVVPGPLIDTKLVRRASQSRWGRLLQAGIRIYEFQPTNFHCKIMVADGRWSSVGSTNFDSRSFRLNDEANLNVYDAPFATQLERTFEADKKRSREITYEAWKNRPAYEKVWDGFWGLFHQQL
jgi:cardiolipin synthase